MSIQFQCPSCKNPIEIDDQWASHSVACPYCQNTVTAPAESSFVPPSAVPEASPVGMQHAPAGQTNRIAVIALVLSCLSLACLIGMQVILAPKILEALGPDATPEEAQNWVQEQIEDGQPPAWLINTMLVMLLSGLLWMAGLVCGIIGVTRPVRRGMAMGAFVVLGVAPLLVCIGAG